MIVLFVLYSSQTDAQRLNTRIAPAWRQTGIATQYVIFLYAIYVYINYSFAHNIKKATGKVDL